MEQSQATGALGGAGQGAAIGAQVGGPWGAVIGAGVGAVAGFLGGGGEEDAEKLAEEQALLVEATARENERRALIQMSRVTGAAKTASYASGLIQKGTTKRYQNALASSMRNDMSWERQKARLDAKAVRAGGQVAANQIKSRGIASAISGVGAAASSGALGSYDKDAGGYASPWS